MIDTKEETKNKKLGTKTWNIILLFCVLVSTCTCVLVAILLVNNYNQETPKDDADILIQLRQTFPDFGILQNCEFLKLVLNYEMLSEKEKILDAELKNTIKDFKAKHCNQSAVVCDANARFRTLDGSCNNLRYPRRGMASRAQSRFLRPFYRNDKDLPRTHSVTGHDIQLPNPRMISNTLFKAGDMPQNSTLTVMHMAFGQFIAHDMTLTPVHKEQDGRDLDCCLDKNKHKPECMMRVTIFGNDTLKQDCMNFVRSLPAIPDSQQNYRDQMNRVTSYIDASTVYGSNMLDLNPLRAHSKGHLIVDKYNRLPAGPNKCTKQVEQEYCQDAASSGWSTGYDEQLDATMANGFGVAAFRFGHSQITNTLAQFSESNTRNNEVLIEETFHKPQLCEGSNGAGCEGILRWMSKDRATIIDRFFETGIRNKLFPDDKGRTTDLPAFNTHRGRDHGIPTYNSWREFCNLTRATHFQTDSGGLVNHSPEAAAALREVYNHVDDIDLFPGAMSETHIRGGSVGPTIACILGSQFRNSKNGDRFWYERNNGNMGLTLEQLGEIRKIRLSNIICNNIPVTEIQPYVFQAVSESNALENCEEIQPMNLEFWRSLI